MLVTTRSAAARHTKATASENTESRWRRRSLRPARHVRTRPPKDPPIIAPPMVPSRRRAHAAARVFVPVLVGLAVLVLEAFFERGVAEALGHVGGLAVVEHHHAPRAHVEQRPVVGGEEH